MVMYSSAPHIVVVHETYDGNQCDSGTTPASAPARAQTANIPPTSFNITSTKHIENICIQAFPLFVIGSETETEPSYANHTCRMHCYYYFGCKSMTAAGY